MKLVFLSILFPLLLAGCTLEQLKRAESTASGVHAAATQPSATDLFPYGTEIKLAAGAAAAGVALVLRKVIKDKAARELALEQVVAGVEDVLGVKTEEQKLRFAAKQDEATKVLVSKVKVPKKA
jgi:hypothetical protein